MAKKDLQSLNDKTLTIDEMLQKETGERVVYIRKKYGLTQKEFSEYVGMVQPTIANIEKGKRPLDEKNAEQWANLFGVNQNWLKYGNMDNLYVYNYEYGTDYLFRDVKDNLKKYGKGGFYEEDVQELVNELFNCSNDMPMVIGFLETCIRYAKNIKNEIEDNPNDIFARTDSLGNPIITDEMDRIRYEDYLKHTNKKMYKDLVNGDISLQEAKAYVQFLIIRNVKPEWIEIIESENKNYMIIENYFNRLKLGYSMFDKSLHFKEGEKNND